MSREIAKIILPKEKSDQELIYELLDTIKDDVFSNQLTPLNTLFEVLIKRSNNREILEEYLS
tara:strand:+ start:494 stop:679 length:186 start_codon:yes stop_codon:yes gene_type:complete